MKHLKLFEEKKITINDILEGHGEEYILLAKHNGEYKIHYTAKNVFELTDKLNKLCDSVKKKK